MDGMGLCLTVSTTAYCIAVSATASRQHIRSAVSFICFPMGYGCTLHICVVAIKTESYANFDCEPRLALIVLNPNSHQTSNSSVPTTVL